MSSFFSDTINEIGGLMDFDFEKWMLERRMKKQGSVESLEGFRQFMLKKGFKYLVVYYEGGGDSGECYEMEGYKTIKSFKENDDTGSEYISFRDWENKDKNGKPIVIPEDDAYKKGTKGQYNVFKALKQWKKKTGEDIDAWKITELIDYDWYNNDGGSGRVIFDLKKGEINIIGYQYTQAYYDITEKLYTDGKPGEYYYGDEVNAE